LTSNASMALEPFNDYMHAWLYGERGYYTTFAPIGKAGDFYTAVSTSKFFGGSIARYLIRRIDEGALSEHTCVCEIGAHKGYMLADMIEFIYTLRPALLETLSFGIVERKADVAQAQRDYFRDAFGDAVKLLHFDSIESMGEAPLAEAFFVANEIFDAFPCALVYEGKTALVDEAHHILFEGDDSYALEMAHRYGRTKGEVAIGYEAFASAMARAAHKSEFVTFDYGDITPRYDFSIRLYAAHKVHPLFEEGLDLGAHFGRSDITYDVHFDHLIEAYREAGFGTRLYATQLKALVEFGLLELLQMVLDNAGFDAYTLALTKVKTLIDPAIMGERFKMVHFIKE